MNFKILNMLTPKFSYHFVLLRYPSILRQQSGLSAGWQSSPLAQILAGAHRDGCPFRLHSAPSAPTQRPLRSPVPPQSRLDPLSNHSHGQPRHPVPLTSPRLPDRLQSLSPGLHRSATECRHGPPLGTVKSYSPYPKNSRQTRQINQYKAINKITRLCIVFSLPSCAHFCVSLGSVFLFPCCPSALFQLSQFKRSHKQASCCSKA